MTAEDAKQRRRTLEASIEAGIRLFEEQTGLVVTDVRVRRHGPTEIGGGLVSRVTIAVEAMLP